MRLGSRAARWCEGDARVTNGALCVLGFVLVMLAHQFVAETVRFQIGYSGVSLLASIVYAGAVLIVLTQPVNRATVWIVVGIAAPMYAIPYLAAPHASTDIFRYVWDGIVQHAHISPYRYVPGDAALSWLQDRNQEIFTHINRRNYARTIYPPVAQMVYWMATWLAPTVAAMKLTMLAFVGLAAWALSEVLQRLGRARAEVLLWLWCPMVVWEVGNAGHVDAVICGLLALAVLFRARDKPGWVGFFLGCAVMTKFYPLVLFPALYQRRDWKMPAVLVSVCVVGYACYASVGRLVFGFLSGYSKEEGIDSGTRFFGLDWVHSWHGLANVPKGAFLVFAALVLGLIALWAWRHASVESGLQAHSSHRAEWGTGRGGMGMGTAFGRAAAAIGLAFMLLFSPHYAWYLLWLVPLLTLAPSLPMFVYVLGFFYGFTTGLAAPGPKMFLLNERLYAAVALAFVLEAGLRRWPVWKRVVATERTAQWGMQQAEARTVGAYR